MKLAAVVVVYNPDLDQTISNIMQFIDFVDALVIWQNSPVESSFKVALENYSSKIVYKGTDRNEGIGYALNRSINWAIENGYSAILTMDQDSFFEDFKTFNSKVEEYFDRIDIGIYAPTIKSPYNNITDLSNNSNDFRIIDKSITSGSIYKIELFEKIGFFKEDYFIDVIDTEFCLRAKKNNIQVMEFTNCFLKQEFGSITKSKLGFMSRNYSPKRLYFIIRNNIWLWKEYGSFYPAREKKYFVNYIFIQSFKIMVHESNKFSKYKAMLKGIYDGISRSSF